MSITIAPGFDKERAQLVRLLDRAAKLSHALRLCVNGASVEVELNKITKSMQELRNYQDEKR